MGQRIIPVNYCSPSPPVRALFDSKRKKKGREKGKGRRRERTSFERTITCYGIESRVCARLPHLVRRKKRKKERKGRGGKQRGMATSRWGFHCKDFGVYVIFKKGKRRREKMGRWARRSITITSY